MEIVRSCLRTLLIFFVHTLSCVYLGKTNTSPCDFSPKGLCSIQGVVPQFQSRAHLNVDGYKLLASGFNVSADDGRLALQLSYSPLASNQTRPQFSLGTSLSAQVKGQIVLTP